MKHRILLVSIASILLAPLLSYGAVPMCPMAKDCTTAQTMNRWYECNAQLQFTHGLNCAKNLHYLGANPAQIKADCRPQHLSAVVQQKKCMASMKAAQVPGPTAVKLCVQ